MTFPAEREARQPPSDGKRRGEDKGALAAWQRTASDSPQRTILVVDDTPAMLDLARECLEESGYRVLTCLLSHDALAIAQREHPDVVMLDVVMPEVSGWTVLERMRADPSLFATPVIICTAYIAEALGRLSELQGPNGDRHLGFLPKPFDVEELLEVVDSITGRDDARHAAIGADES